jgi:orotate phosphoribosyltransferase
MTIVGRPEPYTRSSIVEAPRQQEVIRIVRDKGLSSLPEPVRLASGAISRDFVDGKAALGHGEDLRTACEAILELVEGIEFDAVGGLTMGADQFAHGIALLAAKNWFVVRKEPKGRGTNKLVEGVTITAGDRVLLVDDVVTSGGSIKRAHGELVGLGARVVAAVALVDRSDVARGFFRDEGIPYFAVVTYRDLGIEPVHAGEPVHA